MKNDIRIANRMLYVNGEVVNLNNIVSIEAVHSDNLEDEDDNLSCIFIRDAGNRFYINLDEDTSENEVEEINKLIWEGLIR